MNVHAHERTHRPRHTLTTHALTLFLSRAARDVNGATLCGAALHADPFCGLSFAPSHLRRGKADAEGNAWIGIEFGSLVEVGCVQMFQAHHTFT